MSRSLGRLTLDLVAKTGGFTGPLDKASRHTRKASSDMARDAKRIGLAFSAAATTAAAGFAVMAVNTVNSVTELKTLAQVANTSTQELQRLSYGAQRFGVDQSKVSDILKDVNDRIGDFIQTGGGPMVDFFENIAPLVGVTADQFANLAGPDALQLFVSSLEKANISQADMVFYMEAMASDSTRLLPLLRNNGEEMRRLGDEAERTGNVFDEMEIARLTEVKQSIDELAAAGAGLKNQITLAALPALQDMIALLNDPETLGNAESLGSAIVSSMEMAARAVSNTIGTVRFLAEEIASTLNGVSSDDIVRMEREAERIREILDGGFLASAQRLRFFGPDGLVKFWDTGELEAELSKLDSSIEAFYESGNRPTIPAPEIESPDMPGAPAGDVGAGASIANTAIREQIDALQLQADVLGKTADEITLYNLSLEGASDSQIEQAKSILQTIDAFNREQEAIDASAEAARSSREAIESQIKALQSQAETYNLNSSEAELYSLRVAGATEAQLEQAAAALELVDALKAEEEARTAASLAAEKTNQEAVALEESFRSQEEVIRDAYERQRQIVLDNTAVTGEARRNLLMDLEGKLNEDLNDLSQGYWGDYLDGLEERFENMEELAGGMIDRMSSQFGDAFEAMVFDSQSLEESFWQLSESMARSIVSALGEMAAQWLAYQAVQMLVGKSTQASAASTLTANAIAGQQMAGINAFSSTAAIPIVGPPAAPAAAAAAIAATTPMVAAVTAASLTGMAHDGIMSVPQTGTWLLQQGERVTTAETSAKMDDMLDRAANGVGRAEVNQTINVQGRVDRRTANQIAAETARKQRMAQQRFGA